MRLAAVAVVALGLVVASATHAQELVHLSASGAVAHPGEMIFTGAPRLADMVKAAQVDRDAYILGAAWLRPSLQPGQARLKTGLLFDLGIIERTSDSNGREPVMAIAQHLRAWIDSMPVTGRQVVHTLEPHELQVSAADNLPVQAGDQLVYPTRPDTVRVVGAVEHDCSLPHAGLKDVRGYLAQCPSSRFADPDVVYVVEPDGTVFEHGIGLWNRGPPLPVAPGAILYVPFGHKAITAAADPGFNRGMADFIATQPIGGSGVGP
jgi:hypothetical protein